MLGGDTYACILNRNKGRAVLIACRNGDRAVFPVIFNGVIVGAEISALATGGFTWQLFLMSGASVALSETVVCFLLGLPLCAGLEKLHVFEN